MKQLVLELPYDRLWTSFFGRLADRVEVLEALKCFKCDDEGFAIMCRIKFLDGRMKVQDLKRGGRIKNAELLYSRSDGSKVVFFSGGSAPGSAKGPSHGSAKKVFTVGPPEFIDVNTVRVTLVGEAEELQKYVSSAVKLRLAPKILSLTGIEPKDSPLANLSPRQRQALVTAFGLGYYEVPRKVSSADLARLLKINKATLAEHLRKAERRAVGNIVAS